MKANVHVLAAYAVGAIALIGAVVLVGTGHSVPGELWVIGAGGVGVGGGATIPSFSTTPAPTSSAPAAPVAAPPAA